MRFNLKRVCAYFIDIILVSLVATLLSSNIYINKDYNKYNKTYDEYNNEYDLYQDYIKKLDNFYEDKQIEKNEYDELLNFSNKYSEKLIDLYEDGKLEENEYEVFINDISSKYLEIELNYNYKILKYSNVTTIINIMCILLYFVVFQYYFEGQTFGKKLMKIKVVSNNNKELSLLNYFIRSLIVNEVIINVINVVLISVLSKNNYINSSKIIYIITFIFELTIIFMMLFDKNKRGLHDYLSNTKVIEDKKE